MRNYREQHVLAANAIFVNSDIYGHRFTSGWNLIRYNFKKLSNRHLNHSVGYEGLCGISVKQVQKNKLHVKKNVLCRLTNNAEHLYNKQKYYITPPLRKIIYRRVVRVRCTYYFYYYNLLHYN